MKKLPALAFVALLGIGHEASATHFRGMTVSYEQGTGANANQVTYRVTESWRRSFFGNPAVGMTISTRPDNSFSGSQASTVVAVNTSQDWLVSSRTFTVTYPTIGTYTSAFTTCCRVSTLQEGNGSGNVDVRATVVMDAAGGARSPDVVGFDLGIFPTDLTVATLLPNNPFLVHLTNNAANTFRLGVSLPAPGANWTYNITPTSASGLSDRIPGSQNALSLSPTGDFTWNTPNCLNCLYGFQMTLNNTVTGASWAYDMIFTLTDQPLSNFWTLYPPTEPPAPVPVPAAGLLLGAGLLSLAGVSRRRRVAA